MKKGERDEGREEGEKGSVSDRCLAGEIWIRERENINRISIEWKDEREKESEWFVCKTCCFMP